MCVWRLGLPAGCAHCGPCRCRRFHLALPAEPVQGSRGNSGGRAEPTQLLTTDSEARGLKSATSAHNRSDGGHRLSGGRRSLARLLPGQPGAMGRTVTTCRRLVVIRLSSHTSPSVDLSALVSGRFLRNPERGSRNPEKGARRECGASSSTGMPYSLRRSPRASARALLAVWVRQMLSTVAPVALRQSSDAAPVPGRHSSASRAVAPRHLGHTPRVVELPPPTPLALPHRVQSSTTPPSCSRRWGPQRSMPLHVPQAVARHPQVTGAIELLEERFRDPGQDGPSAYASFLATPGDEEEKARFRQEAVATVRGFLRGLREVQPGRR